MIGQGRIAFIGGGHITEIILHNLQQGRVVPAGQLIVSDPNPERLQLLRERFEVETTLDNIAAAQRGDLILVNVRPEVVAAVVPDLQAARLRTEQVVISLAAGVPLSRYAPLGEQQSLVRALPNPPSRIGQGVAALAFGPRVTAEQRETVRSLFAALGVVVEVEERDLNVITALSSPVVTHLFFQSLIDAGVRCGLSQQVATRVAAQTIIGGMALWRAQEVAPYELIAEASTPGGVSVESLYVLEQHAFKGALMEAIAKGAERAAALGQS